MLRATNSILRCFLGCFAGLIALLISITAWSQSSSNGLSTTSWAISGSRDECLQRAERTFRSMNFSVTEHPDHINGRSGQYDINMTCSEAGESVLVVLVIAGATDQETNSMREIVRDRFAQYGRESRRVSSADRDGGHQDSSAIEDCDRMAAHPLDFDRPDNVPGVDFSEIEFGAALEACRRAVEAFPDHTRMQWQMGRVLHGLRRYSEARSWYERAIESGNHPGAQSNLGYMFMRPQGVVRNPVRAVYWFRRAARQGNPEAQSLLARQLLAGEGVERNPEQAYFWFLLAQRYIPNQARFGMDRAGGELSAARREAVQGRARSWRPTREQ